MNETGPGRNLTWDEKRRETLVNHKVFRVLIEEPGRLVPPGRFALIHRRQLVGVFETREEALDEGRRRFSDDHYSVHCDRRQSDVRRTGLPSSLWIPKHSNT